MFSRFLNYSIFCFDCKGFRYIGFLERVINFFDKIAEVIPDTDLTITKRPASNPLGLSAGLHFFLAVAKCTLLVCRSE